MNAIRWGIDPRRHFRSTGTVKRSSRTKLLTTSRQVRKRWSRVACAPGVSVATPHSCGAQRALRNDESKGGETMNKLAMLGVLLTAMVASRANGDSRWRIDAEGGAIIGAGKVKISEDGDRAQFDIVPG